MSSHVIFSNLRTNYTETYHELYFPNTSGNNQGYTIKINTSILNQCPLIKTMINSGMKETQLYKNGSRLTINIETNVQAIDDYFIWLGNKKQKSNNIDALVLADYLGDIDFEQNFDYQR